MTHETHTPLPWVYDETCHAIWSDEKGVFDSLDELHGDVELVMVCEGLKNPNDAAFIVRACNAHDELVAALENLREDFRMLQSGEWKPNEDSVQASLDIANAALAKARGEA